MQLRLKLSIFFIIYYDDTKFRAYSPIVGNAYNIKTKEALGNDETDPDDAEVSIKLMKEDFLNRIEIDGIPVIDREVLTDEIKILKEDLEEFIGTVYDLTDDDLIKNLVKEFSDKYKI